MDFYADDAFDDCAECEEPLDLDDPRQAHFCSQACADGYATRQRQADNDFASALLDAERMGAEYRRLTLDKSRAK